MKYIRNNARSAETIAEVQKVVARHGSILRIVPQETDIGIDGFIEPIRNEESTADLIAIQIKGGDSFERPTKGCFTVPVDERHLSYWRNLLMPVLLICHSEAHGLCWTSIHDEMEAAQYHGNKITSIDIPYANHFTIDSLEQIANKISLRYRHQFSFLSHIDRAFDREDQGRLSAINMICQHPCARYSPAAALVARKLLEDRNDDIARKAVWFLGFCTGRSRWSWNPVNQDEGVIAEKAAEFCADIDARLFKRLFDIVWDQGFKGSYGLPERLSDISVSILETATDVLMGVAADKSENADKRKIALYVRFLFLDEDIVEEINNGNTLVRELLADDYSDMLDDD